MISCIDCGREAMCFVSDNPAYLGESMCTDCAAHIEKFAKRHGIQLYKSTIPAVHAPGAAPVLPQPIADADAAPAANEADATSIPSGEA